MKKLACILLSLLVVVASVVIVAGCSDTNQQGTVYYHVAVDGGTGAGIYEENAVCQVVATVPQGMQFMKWLKNGVEVSVNETYSFNVTENSRLIAVFGDSVANADGEVCYVSLLNGIGGGGYIKGSTCTVTIPQSEMYRTFKGWVQIVDGERSDFLSTDKSYTFTVQGNVTLEAVYGDVRLPMPDNSENRMFNLVAGQARIEYDKQVGPDGTVYSAFVEGVFCIRIYIYVSPDNDAEPIGYLNMFQRDNGTAYFASANGSQTFEISGTPGDYYTPDGNTHNWLKVRISEMSDGAYSTEKTYYFATQAIGQTMEDGFTYLDSEISGKGRGVKNM